MSADGQARVDAPNAQTPEPTLEDRLRERLGILPEEDPPAWLKPQKPAKLKSGFVAFDLSMMDRNLAFGACQFFCQRKGEKKIENHQNLDRVRRILKFEETLEFFAALSDVKGDMTREWNGQRMRYNRWRDWKAGLPVKVDAALEGEDGVKTIIEPFDPNQKPPLKPSLQPPMLPKEEECGPVRTVHIPAKLVVWMEKALKAADWGTNQTEYVVSLCRKFNVQAKADEDEDENEEGEEKVELEEADGASE